MFDGLDVPGWRFVQCHISRDEATYKTAGPSVRSLVRSLVGNISLFCLLGATYGRGSDFFQ